MKRRPAVRRSRGTPQRCEKRFFDASQHERRADAVRVLRLPLFIDDLADAYAYLAARSPSSADRLLDDVELLIELLASAPGIGRPRSERVPACDLLSFALSTMRFSTGSKATRSFCCASCTARGT